MSETYDFIIVGAGSAGCVLAERLSANRRYSVLALEAGGSDSRFWIQVPIGYGRIYYDQRVNWKYQTEADPGIGGRKDYWPRGKVLGGSGSINAMVYIRGQAEDYEDWVAAGNPGWGYADVLPTFKKSEDNSRRRCLDHAADNFRQHQRPHHHDRRARRRFHSRGSPWLAGQASHLGDTNRRRPLDKAPPLCYRGASPLRAHSSVGRAADS